MILNRHKENPKTQKTIHWGGGIALIYLEMIIHVYISPEIRTPLIQT